MPVRIAFIDDSELFWIIADWCIDCLFFIDLFVNFFSAYFDSDENLVVEKKVIKHNNYDELLRGERS